MLAACYECGKEISSDAVRCPNCGYSYTYGYDGLSYHDVEKIGSGNRRMSPLSAHMAHEMRVFREDKEREKREEAEHENAMLILAGIILAGMVIALLFHISSN